SQFFGTRTKKGDEVVRALGKRRTDFTPQELAAYGRYCCDDAELTYELLMEHLLAATPQDELRLIDWTVRCFAEPKLMLDQQVLEKELAAYHQRKETMLRAAGVEDISVLRSDARMAQALTALGVEPPTKLSPKQKNPDGSPKQVWAFSKQDVEFMDLLESDDEAIAALVEARLGL
ncbi:hypothetical protein LPJ08_29170, partial [Klebsiella pneumoniae]|nr:hypothetical protein [Klebsiella pneumoniae]